MEQGGRAVWRAMKRVGCVWGCEWEGEGGFCVRRGEGGGGWGRGGGGRREPSSMPPYLSPPPLIQIGLFLTDTHQCSHPAHCDAVRELNQYFWIERETVREKEK